MTTRPSSRRKSKSKSFVRCDTDPQDMTRELRMSALTNGNGFSRDGGGFNLCSGRKCDLAQSYNLIKHSPGFLKTKIPDINSPRQTGTPQYKSKEEYYDEVLQARKEIASIRHENATLKTRCRRLEEDNIKKEREITGLLDPSKNEELRRTLTDRRSDSGSMVSGLKQKILKLESQLKANEASYQKLRSDVKTTRVEELQIQMETLYHEVTRLRTANKEQRAFKDNFNTTKIKALSETVLRLNQSMEELRGENFALKKDLMEMANQGKVVECGTPRKAKANSSKLEDMTKQELLDLIATQNQIIEHFENKKKHLAQYLANRAMNKVPGKVTLQGDVWRQVEQLDQQESQLLKELKVAKDKKKLMKSDKNRFKKRNEELEQECYKLQLTIKELELKPKTDPNNTTTTTTTTTTANTTTTTANTTTTTTPAATTVTTTDATSLEQHHRHPRSSTAPHPDRLSRRESKAREMSGENSKKVNQEGRFSVKTRLGPTTEEVTKLRENHAAKSIQRAWRHHHNYDHEDKQDRQAAAGAAAAAAAAAAAEETVQAAVKGHLARHKVLQRAGEPVTSGGGGGGGLEKAVLLIQSVLRGHHTRRRRLLQSRDRNNPSMEPLMAR